MLTVSIDISQAKSALLPLSGGRSVSDGATKVAARAVLDLCKAHLKRKNAAGIHKFWGEAAESARVEQSPARVVIPRQGMHWQRYGGIHKAKPGGAIAIPLRDEDDNIWPAEKFGPKGADPDVFVYRRPSSDRAFLGRREGGALRLYYLLLKSVSKGPDASVLPTGGQIGEAARKAAADFVNLQIRRLRLDKGKGNPA